MPSERDIVAEARELLSAATPEPWRAVAYVGKEPRHITAGKFTEETPIATPENPNGLVAFADLPTNAQLIARAPELLRALADEVERLRKQLVTAAQDARHDAQAAADEAYWRDKQGDEYGSY